MAHKIMRNTLTNPPFTPSGPEPIPAAENIMDNSAGSNIRPSGSSAASLSGGRGACLWMRRPLRAARVELTLVRTTKHNEAAQITAKTLPSFDLPRTAMYNDLNIAMNFMIKVREKSLWHILSITDQAFSGNVKRFKREQSGMLKELGKNNSERDAA